MVGRAALANPQPSPVASADVQLAIQLATDPAVRADLEAKLLKHAKASEALVSRGQSLIMELGRQHQALDALRADAEAKVRAADGVEAKAAEAVAARERAVTKGEADLAAERRRLADEYGPKAADLARRERGMASREDKAFAVAARQMKAQEDMDRRQAALDRRQAEIDRFWAAVRPLIPAA